MSAGIPVPYRLAQVIGFALTEERKARGAATSRRSGKIGAAPVCLESFSPAALSAAGTCR